MLKTTSINAAKGLCTLDAAKRNLGSILEQATSPGLRLRLHPGYDHVDLI